MDEGIHPPREGGEVMGGLVRAARPQSMFPIRRRAVPSLKEAPRLDATPGPRASPPSGFRAADLRARIRNPGLVLNGLVDLPAMHGHILGSFDAQAHLVTTDFDHGHRDIVVDDNALVLLAGENQHRRSSLGPIALGAYHPLL